MNNILDSIPIITTEKLEKLTIEDVLRIHPSLSIDDPLTYIIYLCKADLNEEEKLEIINVIDRLKDNEKTINQKRCETMENANY